MCTAMLKADTSFILPARSVSHRLRVLQSASRGPRLSITRQPLRQKASSTNKAGLPETLLCTRDGPQPTTHFTPSHPDLRPTQYIVICTAGHASPAGTFCNMILGLHTTLTTIYTMLSSMLPLMNVYSLILSITNVQFSKCPLSKSCCTTPSAGHPSYAPVGSPSCTYTR